MKIPHAQSAQCRLPEEPEMNRTLKARSLFDAHVGSQLRKRRVMLGMSQQKLAAAFDLSFQQVQKYEHGINRMGSSRTSRPLRSLTYRSRFFSTGRPAASRLSTA
jgi:ribosome-binding protein aMBF1 (putative translation factor)